MQARAQSTTEAPNRVAYLSDWIEERLGERPDMGSFVQSTTGFSAETLYANLPTANGEKLVIRLEKPGGEVFMDSDIALQGQVMVEMARNGVPVPPVVGIETDATKIGSRFLVMRHVPGRCFPTRPNFLQDGWVKDLPADRQRRVWESSMALLGQINRLEPGDGFEFLARPQYGAAGIDQYIGAARAWRRTVLGDKSNRVLDAALDYLEANKPPGLPVNLLWGDANPGNILYTDQQTVGAALDFEAAALGPAEADLGWWLFMERNRSVGFDRLPGMPSREECTAMYSQALGRTAVAVEYFEILGGFRMSMVIASTVEQLGRMDLMPQGTDAAEANPMLRTLSGLLDIEPPQIGSGFHAFVKAVTSR
jgi:aminoglycoside phosphotransferase (APT) family kinase protein